MEHIIFMSHYTFNDTTLYVLLYIRIRCSKHVRIFRSILEGHECTPKAHLHAIINNTHNYYYILGDRKIVYNKRMKIQFQMYITNHFLYGAINISEK